MKLEDLDKPQKTETEADMALKIYEMECRIQRELKEKGFPVRSLAHKYGSDSLLWWWLIAALTIACVLAYTLISPYARGFEHYIRSGAGWVVMLYYGFGAIHLTFPMFDLMGAFKESRHKGEELPLFITFIAPAAVGWLFCFLLLWSFLQ